MLTFGDKSVTIYPSLFLTCYKLFCEFSILITPLSNTILVIIVQSKKYKNINLKFRICLTHTNKNIQLFESNN